LPILDHKRRMIFAPAYAAPQTRRRQAAIVARDPNFLKRPHSAGAQRPLCPRAVFQRAENSRARAFAVGQKLSVYHLPTSARHALNRGLFASAVQNRPRHFAAETPKTSSSPLKRTLANSLSNHMLRLSRVIVLQQRHACFPAAREQPTCPDGSC
jgi:hypothetical protein